MPTILLVKAIDITKGTPLGGNIDISKYLPVIKEVQIFVIENILGTKLYNKVVTDFAADTLTGDYLTLLENYIQPILIHSTAAEFIIQHAYTVGNGGIFKHLPENAETATKEEISFLSENQRGKADTYIERMQTFLCDTNLPEYTGSQDENYNISPDKSFQYSGGWDLSE